MSKSTTPSRYQRMKPINHIWPALILVTLLAAQAAAAQSSQTVLPQFIVHLQTGPAWQADLPPNEQTGFAEHSANMRNMRERGEILYGARYEDYGMLIIAAESIDEVHDLLDHDPGVLAEIFVYRVARLSVFYPWQTP